MNDARFPAEDTLQVRYSLNSLKGVIRGLGSKLLMGGYTGDNTGSMIRVIRRMLGV